MEKIIIDGKECLAERGSSLSQVLQQYAEFALPCAGNGRCGKCKVKAAGALSEMEEREKEKLTEAEIGDGIRLACYTKVLGNCEVWIPEKKSAVIMQDGILPEQHQAGENPLFKQLGVAVDIGTTTMAARLYTREGMAAQAAAENPQIRFGADVISRIEESLGENRKELAEVVRDGIQSLLVKLAEESGCRVEEIDTLVITGNTAMLYFLTERDPYSLSRAPFEADWLGNEWRKGSDFGFSCAEADIYLPPCISAFVGADIVTAILASGLCEADKTKLLVDIGTNGEIALWKEGKLYCCSTAAGPAFEGTGLSMGMPGKEGAVSHVKLENGMMTAEVIGGGTPEGICGSGVIDGVSCLLKMEELDETGYLEEEEAVIIGDVKLTQEDIRKVQLAKSAICAGMKTVLHNAGIAADNLTELLVAGGFGSYLNLENAIHIGLLPEVSTDKVTVCGNAALSGAVMVLQDRDRMQEVQEIAARAHSVELASDAFFQETYIDEMFF